MKEHECTMLHHVSFGKLFVILQEASTEFPRVHINVHSVHNTSVIREPKAPDARSEGFPLSTCFIDNDSYL